MDEYRRLTLLSSIKEELVHEAAEARWKAQSAQVFRARAGRVVMTLTVVLLGMAAWWGR